MLNNDTLAPGASKPPERMATTVGKARKALKRAIKKDEHSHGVRIDRYMGLAILQLLKGIDPEQRIEFEYKGRE